jgi:hypothetical protein
MQDDKQNGALNGELPETERPHRLGKIRCFETRKLGNLLESRRLGLSLDVSLQQWSSGGPYPGDRPGLYKNLVKPRDDDRLLAGSQPRHLRRETSDLVSTNMLLIHSPTAPHATLLPHLLCVQVTPPPSHGTMLPLGNRRSATGDRTRLSLETYLFMEG